MHNCTLDGTFFLLEVGRKWDMLLNLFPSKFPFKVFRKQSALTFIHSSIFLKTQLQQANTMKSPFSIATILAFITCSNGQTLRTSSEERVLLASVSDSTKMGNEEYHLSSDHTQGLSSGMDSKSHVNDISSRIQHGDIHEDVKSPKGMWWMCKDR